MNLGRKTRTISSNTIGYLFYMCLKKMKYSGFELDVHLLKTGMLLKKLRNGVKHRYYCLDLENNNLVATTKVSNKESKTYSLSRFDEAVCGCKTASLKYYGARCSIYEDIENRAFVLYFDKYKTSLKLIAPSQLERDRWVRLLNFSKKEGSGQRLRKRHEDSSAHFKRIDKNNDKVVDRNEIASYLKSLNIKIDKNKLNQLIKTIDRNADGVLDETEFQEFFDNLLTRTDVRLVFDQNTENRNFMSVEEFKKFLENEQGEDISIEECTEIVKHYEPTSFKNESKLSFIGFDLFLNDKSQHLMNPSHEKIYQPMDLPVTDYFINSSHNTYLSGDQIKSKSKVECYISVLIDGCRLIEHGPNGDPLIYHNYTLTSKIRFEDVIIAIKEYAFKTSDYPVILTFENHCSVEQDKKLAYYVYVHLKEFLFNKPIEPFETRMPPLESLKRMIFIRSRKNSAIYNIQNPECVKDLINLFQTNSFKSVEDSIMNNKAYQGHSIVETDAEKLIQNEPEKTLILTNQNVMKVYPSGLRHDSSNVNPTNFWPFGFQIVALNLQTNDKAKILNEALFSDNGNCGYVLKPVILRERSLGFNPFNVNTMKNKIELTVKIITAQDLPRRFEESSDIPDPYVVVSIHGVPADEQEYRTETVENNGYRPEWNETCKFTINCPELAFVRFTVLDENTSIDTKTGEYAIRLKNMRKGYRHLQLKNKQMQGSLFIKVTMNDIQLK